MKKLRIRLGILFVYHLNILISYIHVYISFVSTRLLILVFTVIRDLGLFVSFLVIFFVLSSGKDAALPSRCLLL